MKFDMEAAKLAVSEVAGWLESKEVYIDDAGLTYLLLGNIPIRENMSPQMYLQEALKLMENQMMRTKAREKNIDIESVLLGAIIGSQAKRT